MDFHITDVCTEDFNRGGAVVTLDHLAASLNHGFGAVDRNDFASFGGDAAPHRKRGGAERAAQIVQGAAGLAVMFGQRFDHRNNGSIARHGTSDHIGENVRYLFVKPEIGNLSQ